MFFPFPFTRWGALEATNRYWVSAIAALSTDSVWALTSGGASGASVPASGNSVFFDGGGVGDCDFAANMGHAGFDMQAAYPGDIDLVTFNLTGDDGADVTLAGSGTFDEGLGTISATNSNVDYSTLETMVAGTATWVLSGTGTLTGRGNVNRVFNLTFDTDSNYQVTGSFIVLSGLLLFRANSTVEIASGQNMLISLGEVQIQPGAEISRVGTGFFRVFSSDIAQQDGVISADCLVEANSTAVGGIYSGLLKMRDTGSTNRTKVLIGAFQVGSLELETTFTGNMRLDVTSLTSMTILGDFTRDINSTGDITVDSTGSSANWDFQGDVIDEVTGGGSFTWTLGDTTVSATSTSDQTWDWGGLPLGAYAHNKAAGAFVLASALHVASFAGTSTGTGSFDPNGQAINSDGNVSWAAAFAFLGDADTFNGCSWSGTNFTADRQDLFATAGWTHTFTGSAVASGAGSVQWSDASGGVGIVAGIGWVDGGNTQNWFFVPLNIETPGPASGVFVAMAEAGQGSGATAVQSSYVAMAEAGAGK